MDYLVLISKNEEGEEGKKLRLEAEHIGELAILADKKDEVKEDLDSVRNWISTLPINDDYEIAIGISKKYNVNISQAKRSLESFPKEYVIKEKKIPTLVKDLKKFRRTLKGEEKIEFSKGIDNLIMAYSDHLSNCIKSIYWLSPYETPLRQMRYTEADLKKIHSIKDKTNRREIIESLCKYWEAELHRGVNYNEDYSKLSKKMTKAKREFRKCINKIPIHSIKKNISSQLDDFVLKSVCENQGISARNIYDKLPSKLHRRSSTQMICKVADRLDITNIEGEYYKLTDEIKKDLYAYTAAFIDSDGYITMDRNHNPRIGMVATGNRGKAFVTELHKELGIGKLHLDQKSPQGTRPVNRLNFYSQGDITTLIGKCRPYFRMKGANADILTELIRIKKNHKKEPWAKERMTELFKLMKWANHADHVNYDFSKDDIDVENISKYKDNCKMNTMTELESIVKSDKVNRAIKEWIIEPSVNLSAVPAYFKDKVHFMYIPDMVNTIVNQLTDKEKEIINNLNEDESGISFVRFPQSVIDKIMNVVKLWEDKWDKWAETNKGNVDEVINDLEEIEEENELTEHEWSSVDDASDYLFEHKGPKGDEGE